MTLFDEDNHDWKRFRKLSEWSFADSSGWTMDQAHQVLLDLKKCCDKADRARARKIKALEEAGKRAEAEKLDNSEEMWLYHDIQYAIGIAAFMLQMHLQLEEKLDGAMNLDWRWFWGGMR